MEARAIITLSKIQVAQADATALKSDNWLALSLGGETGLAEAKAKGKSVAKAKGESGFSLLPPNAQATDFQPWTLWSYYLIGVGRWQLLSHQHSCCNRKIPCINPLPNTQTKVLLHVCVWVPTCVLFLHPNKAMKCAFSPSFPCDAWTAKPICLAIWISDENQLEQRGCEGQ